MSPVEEHTHTAEKIKNTHVCDGIGALDGKWTILLKTWLIIFPAMIPYCAWIGAETIINREFRNKGDRFTTVDATELEGILREERAKDLLRIEEKLGELPPRDWKDRIITLETTMRAIETKLTSLEIEINKVLILQQQLQQQNSQRVQKP